MIIMMMKMENIEVPRDPFCDRDYPIRLLFALSLGATLMK